MSQPQWPSPSLPPREPSFRMSSRRLGVYVLFGSLGVLFIATLVGYFVTRADSANWRAATTPAPPTGLWLSTLLALAISVSLESARRAARKNQLAVLPSRLRLGIGAAVAFLGAQAVNWYSLHEVAFGNDKPAHVVVGFYLLTGLHAAHVLGGIVPLGIVLNGAMAREYSSSRHEGVSLCADYWHFLAVVWLVLFATLELFG
jgi:cytochrome c oxidase subunit 3